MASHTSGSDCASKSGASILVPGRKRPILPACLVTLGAGPLDMGQPRPDRARLNSRPPMPRKGRKPFALAKSRARRIWLRAQKLDESAPFGDGPKATRAAVEHLGYVQIDTIHVVER